MLWGHRPYDIHSITPLDEVLRMQEKESAELSFPDQVSQSFAHLVQRLLTCNVEERIASVEQLRSRCSFCRTVDLEKVLTKQMKPVFVPAKDQLNCDPTFELEEMIIEAHPLHKKKKRLSKQQSISARKALDRQGSSMGSSEPGGDDKSASLAPSSCLDSIHQQPPFIVYNREK